MKIPFIDFKKMHDPIRAEIDLQIKNVIDNNSFILGKAVADFEKNFAEAHKVKHCIGVSSGTDANHLVLWSSGIKQSDEVIMPANTFIATAWGATLCGAKPVFVDCQSDSYNLDPDKTEDKITSRTKAIVAVHLYGQTADMEALLKIAKKYNLILIEDAAQAHLAEYKGIKAGGLSAAASFSFYPGKNLGAFGEGGAVTTNDDELADRIKKMRDHGSDKKYYHELYGHNYRMEGIQGAVLGVKLHKLEDWNNKRREAAKKYCELLEEVNEIQLPNELPHSKHVYHLFVIQTVKRNELQKFLADNGIATGLHYPVPLHLQKCFAHLNYKRGEFPETEKLADRCLSLPMHPFLSDDEIGFVCEKIKHFFKR